MTTVDDEFFNKYRANIKETIGIPNIQMNTPLATNVHVGTIGLELELEPERGYALPRDGHLEKFVSPKTGARWLSIEDGSLRNGGREFIVSSPILPEELEASLNFLWKTFEMQGVRLSNSNRCSTHVHINVSGKKVNHLTSIIVLWGTFEELLINWCGEERKTNHFCLSMKDSMSLVQAWDQFLSAGNTRNFADRSLKYGALNLNPIWTQGSVEFRCGPAADKIEQPLYWAKFLDDFVKYATDVYPNPERIANDLSERGGWQMFLDISKNTPEFREQVFASFSPVEVDEMALSGFRNVQRLALGFPWGDWLPLIDREYVPNPFARQGLRTNGLVRVGRADRLRPQAPQRIHLDIEAMAGREERRQQEFLRAVDGIWRDVGRVNRN